MTLESYSWNAGDKEEKNKWLLTIRQIKQHLVIHRTWQDRSVCESTKANILESKATESLRSGATFNTAMQNECKPTLGSKSMLKQAEESFPGPPWVALLFEFVQHESRLEE